MNENYPHLDLKPAHTNHTHLRCNECQQSFATARLKLEHNKLIHQIKFKLSESETLAIGLNSQRGNKRAAPTFLETHVCLKCKSYFRDKVERDRHVKARHPNDAIPTLDVDSFQEYASLKPHKAAEQFLQLQACLVCKLFFDDRTQKKKHVETFHKDEPGHWSRKTEVPCNLKPARTKCCHLGTPK